MFDNLTNRLSGVIKTLRGEARLTETNIQEALREVRMALLEADVALPVVKEFIARVKEKAVGQEVIGSGILAFADHPPRNAKEDAEVEPDHHPVDAGDVGRGMCHRYP